MTTPKKTWSKARRRFYAQKRLYRIRWTTFNEGYSDAGEYPFLDGFQYDFLAPGRPWRRQPWEIVKKHSILAGGEALRRWIKQGYTYW